MGLSCGGRTGGPHGRVSTEVGRPTRLHRGVQAGRRPATPEGRQDARRALARARHPAERRAAVETTVRGGCDRRRRDERRRRADQRASRSPSTHPRARAAARQEADGDRDPPGGAGGRKKKSLVAQRVRAVTQHPIAVVCRALGIARQTAYYPARAHAASFYRRVDDETVLQQIRAVTNSRATYGYRRVWAMVNRIFRAGLQPQAHSPADADARPDAAAAGAPPVWAPTSWPRAAAGVRTSAGARTFPDPVLER